jgi:hypothetical protein
VETEANTRKRASTDVRLRITPTTMSTAKVVASAPPRRRNRLAWQLFWGLWIASPSIFMAFFGIKWNLMSPGLLFQDRSLSGDGHRHHRREPTPEALVWAEQHCNLTNVNWYPHDWHERAPCFLLMGSKKAGTTSLTSYLNQHPYIVPARIKETLFFLPPHLNRRQGEFMDTDGRINVYNVRKALYEEKRSSNPEKRPPTTDYNEIRLSQNPHMISFDASPGMHLFTGRHMRHILCTVPWFKMLLILREPVDRIWSHYNFLLTKQWQGPADSMSSFEAFIRFDMAKLHRAGVLRPRNSSFADSPEEHQAWLRYAEGQAVDLNVARGMLAVPLSHWFRTLQQMGRDPREEILVVRYDDMKNDPNVTLNKIYRWLDIPEVKVPSQAPKMVSRYGERTMNETTRLHLEKFYRPYVERLYNLLEGHDFERWDADYLQDLL